MLNTLLVCQTPEPSSAYSYVPLPPVGVIVTEPLFVPQAAVVELATLPVTPLKQVVIVALSNFKARPYEYPTILIFVVLAGAV